MLIVGERINSTRTKTFEAIKVRNAAFLIKETKDQLDAGAKYIDVNCAITSGDEVQDVDWIICTIQSAIKDVSLCIDSPNYLAIERALLAHKGGGNIMINSITGDEDRIKAVLPLAVKYNTRLIALTMDEKGMPNTAEERLDVARRIFERVKKGGFNTENLYFDALIRPISTEPDQVKEFLASIPMIKSLGNVKTICGLSNVSFGLPNRKLINSIFMAMAIHAGLDAAIIDPLDKNMISSLRASEALLGRDEYCGAYIRAFREGRLI